MFLKISNFTNYTKWCNEIKQEIANRWRLNHIIAAPPENKDPQWKQNDAQVMSWILYTLDTTIANAVLDHTTSAYELWTWISTFVGLVTEEKGSEKGEESRFRIWKFIIPAKWWVQERKSCLKSSSESPKRWHD